MKKTKQPQPFDVIANYTRNQRRYQEGAAWNKKTEDALDDLFVRSQKDFDLNMLTVSDIAEQRTNCEQDLAERKSFSLAREIAVLNDLQAEFTYNALATYLKGNVFQRAEMSHKLSKLSLKEVGELRKCLKQGAAEKAKIANARLEALEEVKIQMDNFTDLATPAILDNERSR